MAECGSSEAVATSAVEGSFSKRRRDEEFNVKYECMYDLSKLPCRPR